MPSYKHTQIGYLMLTVTLAVFILFAWLQLTARAEAPSYDSGTNLPVTAVMMLILFILASFSTLTVIVDAEFVRARFSFGLLGKTLPLNEIAAVKQVKNPWYYGWGLRLWFWPRRWILSVSGLDAVELTMKHGTVYRLGTDEPERLEAAIKANLK